MQVGRVCAALVILFAATTVRSASAEESCISEEAKSVVTCDGNKLKPQRKQGRVKYKPPAADDAGQKTLAPTDPSQGNTLPPRIDRKLQKLGRQYLLREIANVAKLYRDTPKSSKEKPQLLRRLADNYAELEADLFQEQVETEAESQRLRRKNPKKARELAAKAKDIKKRVGKARKEAIRHYKRLANKHEKFCQFPDKPKLADRGCADQALYYLAYEYELDNNFDDAREIYLRIVTDWPKSKYVPHAYLAFGELFFSEAQGDPAKWPLAAQAYEKVIAFPPPANKLWGYAQYKLAYVHWNQGAHDEALAHFQKVIEFGDQHATLPNAKGLQRAARRDIIPVYAMTGDAKKAYKFFKPLSGDGSGESKKTYAMLEDLGQALMDTGHYAQAKVLYTELKKRNGGAKSCIYQVKISKATISMSGGNKEPVIAALEDQLAEYLNNRDGGYSQRMRLGCANHTAALLAETGMAWHLEAVGSGGVRGTNDEATKDAAAKLYGMVADNFTAEQFNAFRFPHLVKEDWPTLATIRYHMADLLWERKKWKACGRAFYNAYEADPNGKDAAEALHAAGLCWQNAVLQAKGADGYRAGRGNTPEAEKLRPRKLADDEKQMLLAFDRYACRIAPPEGDDEALEKHCEVKFARARTYYEAHHFDKAALAFRDVALNHPTCEAAPFAANLYLESMEVMRGKWARSSCIDGMSADAPKIAELHCKTDAQREENEEQCVYIERTKRDLMRLGIQRDLEKVKSGDKNAAKKLAAAGDRYWKMWDEHGKKVCAANDDDKEMNPACEGYDEILHNAAAAYDGAHLLAKAIAVRRTLISSKYRLHDTDVAKRAVFDLGQNHQAIAVYDVAATYYERFASESPKHDKAPTALSDAVVLRLGLGESEKALEDARTFTRTYGKRKPQQAAQIAYAIGEHHAQRKQWRKAQKALSSALKQIESHATPDVRVQALALLGRVNARLEQRSQADKYYGKVRAMASKLPALKKAIDGIDEPEARRLRRYGKAVTAIGEALHYFAKKKKDSADALTFPEYKGAGNTKDVNRFVQTKVLKWLEKKKPAIEAATKEYMKIVHLNDTNPPPRWAIAAGAAIGNMWGELVDDFIEAPYPKEWDQPGYVPGVNPPLLWAELKAIYKAELMKKVAPFKKVAKNAYVECLQYGLLFQHFDGEVRSCEQWLSKTYPREFHLLDELVGTADRASSPLDEHAQPLNVDGTPKKATRKRTSPKKSASGTKT